MADMEERLRLLPCGGARCCEVKLASMVDFIRRGCCSFLFVINPAPILPIESLRLLVLLPESARFGDCSITDGTLDIAMASNEESML